MDPVVEKVEKVKVPRKAKTEPVEKIEKVKVPKKAKEVAVKEVKPKPERTPEQIQAAKDRMKLVRDARKKKEPTK